MKKVEEQNMRERLVSIIIESSGDELEKEDYIKISSESEIQLLDRVESILDYYMQ